MTDAHLLAERLKEELAVAKAETEAAERLLAHQDRLLAALRVEVEELRAIGKEGE